MALNRRELLGSLAAAVVVWPGRGRAAAQASAARVRPGALVTLKCPGADGFLVEAEGCGPVRIGADGRCRAPRIRTECEWTVMRCTPLAGGRRVGDPAEVHVLTVMPEYGA